MNQILLLTKNIYIDTKWQSKIQQLGYEVFCSSELLNRILQKRDYQILSFFKIVLFSESISNAEVSNVIKIVPPVNNYFFRIENELDYQDSLKKVDEKISFINSSMSLTEIRESFTQSLSEVEVEEEFQIEFGTEKKIPTALIAILIAGMSKKEKELFSALYEKKGGFITRSELSRNLWDKEPSNSNLAQLSQIINRLKKKMLKVGLNEKMLLTHWNKGYALSESFYEAVLSYMTEKDLQSLVLTI